MNSTCQNCGALNPADAQFCEKCRAELRSAYNDANGLSQSQSATESQRGFAIDDSDVKLLTHILITLERDMHALIQILNDKGIVSFDEFERMRHLAERWTKAYREWNEEAEGFGFLHGQLESDVTDSMWNYTPIPSETFWKP